MVVYNVFCSCVYHRYKTHICSKATVVLVLISILTVLFPIIFTYKSHGFWLRTDTYQEQPRVSFKYDYVLFFDVIKKNKDPNVFHEEIFLCSNLKKVIYMDNSHNHCPYITVSEEDLNDDGVNDLFKFETTYYLPPMTDLKGISALLLFDYKLSSYCRAEFEGYAFIQYSSYLPGAGIEVSGDLSLVQRQPLNPRRLDVRYNKTALPELYTDKQFVMTEILKEYSLRNLSTKLTNVYTSWTTRRIGYEPFIVEFTITYPEVTVRYMPTTWQVLRYAWAQFFPVLIVSVYIFKHIKSFIFSNQLVNTYREEPWTKSH